MNLDKVLITNFSPLTFNRDLNLWHRVMCLVCTTQLSYISYKNIFSKCHELVKTRYKLQNSDLWPPNVTLTFDVHIIVNIFTMYHINNNMARIRYKLQNFDLWHLYVILTFDIEKWVLKFHTINAFPLMMLYLCVVIDGDNMIHFREIV